MKRIIPMHMLRKFALGLAFALALAFPASASDLSVTAANAVPSSDTIYVWGTAGATITAGQAVYLDTTTSTFKLADNDSATSAARHVDGIALTGSSANQPIAVAKGGTITLGATMTAGVTYYLSGTAGGIAPIADVTSGHDPVIVGVATSTTLLKIAPVDPGVTL